MKKISISILLLVFFNSISFSQNNTDKHQLNVLNSIPEWANNLSSINVGDYNNYVVQDNPKEEIIGFLSWGDREIGIKAPFKSFLYIKLDNNGTFLKFINTKKVGKHNVNTYENGDLKVILDWDGYKQSASGNGDGGTFKLFYKGKIIKTTKFWSSI